ncbi:hypothetical protein [Actinomadura rubrisoli]|uniref:Uncharacterized protein n=1 Tax=Actinomadura rubrisoli TaxID=2530368 RepID=A0A4R5BS26_9ACTN|nr:hypothetical protein [Actinomadura rubrisoli]TDD88366.1 hypothetical protein E1298_15260 [Actinomadura rubrisoli]
MSDAQAEPTDEQIRAYLDAHPEVFGVLLRREIRLNTPWWLRVLRRQARIDPTALRPPPGRGSC